MLYSDEDVDQYVTYPHPETNGYKVINNGAKENDGTSAPGPTWTLKMLMSGAMQDRFSVKPGQLIIT